MFSVPGRVGIGCSAFPSFPSLLTDLGDVIDYVEVGPDTLCREVALDGGRSSMHPVDALLDGFLLASADLEVVVHGVELSIGSPSGWNASYLDVLDDFAGRRPFAWHSEHVGFLSAGPAGAPRHAGVPLPMPFTREAAELVAARAARVAERHDAAFLLENAAFYLPMLPADRGWDEAALLTEIVERADCGLLLDLFNLWTNAVNHGLDACDLLSRMPLERVVEIHVAGGDTVDGYLLDSHSTVVPDAVWDLLAWTLDQAPAVAGVTYEVLESHLPRLGIDAIRTELARLRAVWNAHVGARS